MKLVLLPIYFSCQRVMDCYHVVEFVAGDVAIVPSSWLHLRSETDELLSYWPPYSSDRVTRAVREKLAAEDDWEVYPCRELGKSGMLTCDLVTILAYNHYLYIIMNIFTQYRFHAKSNCKYYVCIKFYRRLQARKGKVGGVTIYF